MFNEPKAFLFTFTPYGTRLHGDERGSVDRFHNRFGEDFVPPNLSYLAMRRDELAEDPLLITPKMRGILVDTIEQHCTFRGWHLFAQNVRTNHIHAVTSAGRRSGAATATGRHCRPVHCQNCGQEGAASPRAV